ncbi:MAG: lysophospholipid acyltransferase family protein [Akkermansiaceae bacterium]|nr:lysophospholipid acyltransferase family protein [Akkermansiaceae bacterium]
MPTRFLLRGLRSAPWFLEPVLVVGWTGMFFLVAGRQRLAVMGNLRALFPGWGYWRAWVGAWRVFHHFAAVYVDAMRVETGTGGVDWAIEGLEHFDELAAKSEGCLVLTAHMGNYDMAAPLFSGMFGRTVYAVRAPEREPEMQRIKEAELRRKEASHPNFRTLYNEGGEMLGVELARLLREGMVVAVQGDRVVFEVSGMEVEVEPGLMMNLPRGPLMLARLTDAPVYPLFILRDGWRRYRVKVMPKLELPPRKRGVDPGAEPWAKALHGVIRERWVEWSVFEPVFTRRKGGES